MHSIVCEDPGHYLIRVLRKELPLPFISMRIETNDQNTEKSLFVPSLLHTNYLLQTDSSNVSIHFDAGEVKQVSLKKVSPLKRNFLLRRKSDRRHTLKFSDGIELTPLLGAEGSPGKELSRALRLIANWGFSLTSNNLQMTPRLFARHNTSQTAPKDAAVKNPGPPRFAIVLHLYYQELWPELESDLLRLHQNFHLIVTTTRVDVGVESQIKNTFPDAEVHVFENRGRDVGPFFQLLHDGRLDAYPFICKLHGKRSDTYGPRALFGEVWRRTNIADLIGSSDQVEKILDRFDTAPFIGMIGSSRFRLPNEFIQHYAAWARNKDLTLALAERMGITQERFRLDFFAGTMFWIRQEALAPLRELNLTLADFTPEDGAVDGKLEHALERVFGAAPRASGMHLNNTSDL